MAASSCVMPGSADPAATAELRDRLLGVMTALVTPFRRDGTVDLDALDDHVRYQIEHRVRVLVVCGTIGESPSLSVEEREQILQRVVSTAGDRALVLAGISDGRLGTIADLARHARQVGAHGFLVMTPPTFKLTDGEQLDFWTWLDEHMDLPFVVYSTPATPSGLPSVALLERVARLHHFAGIKEASPSVARVHQLMRTFGGTVRIIAAVEAPLPYMLLAGAAGLMTASACFAPDVLWRVFDAASAGDVPRLLDAFAPIPRIRDLFQPRMDAGYPSYIPFTKAACDLIGLRSGDPRPPLAPITPDERRTLATVLRDELDTPTTDGGTAQGAETPAKAR